MMGTYGYTDAGNATRVLTMAPPPSHRSHMSVAGPMPSAWDLGFLLSKGYNNRGDELVKT